MGQFPLHLKITLNTVLTWFLFLQTEGVDVKRDKCEAFATRQTASHPINSTKLQRFFDHSIFVYALFF